MKCNGDELYLLFEKWTGHFASLSHSEWKRKTYTQISWMGRMQKKNKNHAIGTIGKCL